MLELNFGLLFLYQYYGEVNYFSLFYSIISILLSLRRYSFEVSGSKFMLQAYSIDCFSSSNLFEPLLRSSNNSSVVREFISDFLRSLALAAILLLYCKSSSFDNDWRNCCLLSFALRAICWRYCISSSGLSESKNTFRLSCAYLRCFSFLSYIL